MREFDVLIIGGGVAGLTAACRARPFGMKTAVFERDRLGGTALWTGALPLRAFLACADLARRVRAAGCPGVRLKGGRVDAAAVLDHVRRVVLSAEASHGPAHVASLGIEVVPAEAAFLDGRTVRAGSEEFRGRRILIATGAREAEPDIEGLGETGYLRPADLWKLEALPKSMAVLGGGGVGVQLAQGLARLDVDVVLIEPGERILPDEDAEVADHLAESLLAEGIRVIRGVEVVEIVRRGEKKVISVRNNGDRRDVEADDLLVTAGRRPDVAALNLEATEVETTHRGIVVDGHLRTGERRAWAIGDCNGQLPCARAAGAQARAAVADSLLPWGERYRPQDAWAVRTDPGVAHAGLTEEQARRRFGDEVRVHRCPFRGFGEPAEGDAGEGFVKLVADPRGKLLGGHVLGPGADRILPVLAQTVDGRQRPAALSDGRLDVACPSVVDGVFEALQEAREAVQADGWRRRLLRRIVRWYV